MSAFQVSNIALGSLKAFGSDDKDLNEEIITLAFENGINFFDISEPFTSKKAEVNFLSFLTRKILVKNSNGYSYEKIPKIRVNNGLNFLFVQQAVTF